MVSAKTWKREFIREQEEEEVAMKVEVEEILHMVGGLGEEQAIGKAKPIVEKSISEVYCTLLPQNLVIVDLGCSSGPTAFMVISNILSAIVPDLCHRLSHHRSPEISFFLNDLPGNDFNTIFKSLTKLEKMVREEIKELKDLPYYVFGAPGSFYGKLFPRDSIHFTHSSYSLHWLSQVPQSLQDYEDTPINCGNIYIAKDSPSGVSRSYLEQFQQDFSMFLKLRAEEIISGGQMVLTFLGRTNLDPLRGEMTYLLELLAEALNSFVSEGLLEKEKVDQFNMPFYAPAMEEVREIIMNQGSFNLHQEYIFELNWDPHDSCDGEFVSDNKLSGENAAKCVRAALEPMLASYFGEEIIDTLFSRYAENVAKHLLKQKTKLVNFTIALKKI
ncbi:anthranilate O-methyltransferase 3-like [Asparagus officinalis]|uniref:anthranilate O-methyltransferase 3-like n=1 Tax=Asparagus officinalis TaxID=4686 RepID=UPI00098E4F1E|nr:anthranilate O-methyltransferase 3-like [Asparagus officinalis]